MTKILIFTDYSKAYVIESLTAPIVAKYFWMFDANIFDFTLQSIKYLEETTGPAVKARINNFEFWIPSNWNILVVDKNTYQIDTVNIQSCANINYSAFAFSPKEMRLKTLDVFIVDYSENESVVHPMINKMTAMAHPVGPDFSPIINRLSPSSQNELSVIIGPNDLYKALSNKVVGDLFE